MICKACGTAHIHVLPGSGALEATLWVLIPCWPAALVYSVWRRSSRRKACESCGSTDLVGLETPVGRQLARAHHQVVYPRHRRHRPLRAFWAPR